jgi:hypothetical protein
MWSYLQQEKQREEMNSGCNRLETVARDFFYTGAGGGSTIDSLHDVSSNLFYLSLADSYCQPM